MKKALSLVLVLTLIASVFTFTVNADDRVFKRSAVNQTSSEETIYCVDVRTSAIDSTMKIGDAEVFVQVTTDANQENFKPATNLEVSTKWYSMYYMMSDIPESLREDYEEYIFDSGMNAYLKPVNNDEYFVADMMYACFVTLDAKAGTTFDLYCGLSAIEPEYTIPTDSRMEAVVFETATAEPTVIETIPITVEDIDFYYNTLTLSLPEIDGDYMYLIKKSDGSYEKLMLNSPVNQPVGETVVKNREFSSFSSTRVLISRNKPLLQIVKVKSLDTCNPMSVIYGYGNYILPIYVATIYVNSILPGEDIEIDRIEDSTFGKYSANIAHLEFKGWFGNADCTNAYTASSDAYAEFTLNIANGMSQEVPCVVLTDGVVTLQSLSITQKSLTDYTFIFKLSKDTAYCSVKTSGGIGTEAAVFADSGLPIAVIQPNESGKLVARVEYTYDAPVYLSDIKVNGVVVPDIIETVERDKSYANDARMTNYVSVELSSTDVEIELVFAPCDVITIAFDKDDETMTYRYDVDNVAHEDNIYYVAENEYYYLTTASPYIKCVNGNIYQELVELNTKADRTGLAILPFHLSGLFTWYSTDEDVAKTYVNGKRDDITLYPIFRCCAHYDSMTDDESYWEYFGEAASECGKPGHVAYRHCKYCGKYEVLKNGFYVDALESEIFTDSPDHDCEWTDNGCGGHTGFCSRCHETVTEPHTYVDGVCTKCGAKLAFVLGDFDGDGFFTSADLIYACQLDAGIITEDAGNVKAIDVDGDGSFTSADLIFMCQYDAGIISVWPKDAK